MSRSSSQSAADSHDRYGVSRPACDADRVNILVVDDLPEKLLAYEVVLEQLGENVVLVASGSEALKQILHTQFAVILLDVNMPDMDGFETARLIRRHRRSSTTPIIFLTAFADEVRTAEGYASGAVDYLPTPVVPEVLLAKVRVFAELFRMRRQVALRAEEKARHAAAEEANRRLMFLSDAGAVLGRSLDFAATVRDLAKLPLPMLGDVSVVAFAPNVVAPAAVVRGRLSIAKEPLLDELPDLDFLPEGVAQALQRALSTGRRICWPDPTILGHPAPPSAIALPLTARDRTFAALLIAREHDGPHLNPQDITMATVLASRAATALDNAMLHEELQRADRQKNEFLSMLAHELRNPLSPIVNAARMLQLRIPDDAELQWAGEVVGRQVSQMVRLVDDLLDVSRITCGKIRLQRQPIDLKKIVAHAVEASGPLIDERGHQLTITVPEQPVWVDGDQARLTQVLTNLLNNAAKYTDDGGQIWLTLARHANNAVLTVRDTGVGIPREMLGTIFDLFTQVESDLDRSAGGLGIGLTLVRQLVQMHGGTITARSEGPGHGSEFIVTLPVTSECLRPSEAQTQPAPAVENGARGVLIVDDNADSADTLATFLRLSGHSVRVAYDGPTALETARAFEPAVVLLDIGLPGLDGYSVASQLREQTATRDSLLIAVSGYDQVRDGGLSRQAGFDDHLTKPVDLNLLLDRLASKVRAAGAAATNSAKAGLDHGFSRRQPLQA